MIIILLYLHPRWVVHNSIYSSSCHTYLFVPLFWLWSWFFQETFIENICWCCAGSQWKENKEIWEDREKRKKNTAHIDLPGPATSLHPWARMEKGFHYHWKDGGISILARMESVTCSLLSHISCSQDVWSARAMDGAIPLMLIIDASSNFLNEIMDWGRSRNSRCT